MSLKLIHVCIWIINTRKDLAVQGTMAKKMFKGWTTILPNVITVALSIDGFLRQLIDAHSNVFENAEQDHVVDAGPDKNDG